MARRSTGSTAGRGDSNGGGTSASPAGGSNPTGGGASNGGGASASTTGGSAATGAPGAAAASENQLSAAIQQILDDVIPGDEASGLSAHETRAYISVLNRLGFQRQAVASLLRFGIPTPSDLAAKSAEEVDSMAVSIQ